MTQRMDGRVGHGVCHAAAQSARSAAESVWRSFLLSRVSDLSLFKIDRAFRIIIGAWKRIDGACPRIAFSRGVGVTAGGVLIGTILCLTPVAEAICKPGLVRRDGSFVPVRWTSQPGSMRMAASADKSVRLRYLGHSSFLITAPDAATALMDPYVIPVTDPMPNAVTVSNYHETHSQTGPYEGKTQIFHGVTADGKPNAFERVFGSLRVMSFPQYAEGVDPAYVENTIFIFQAAGLCIAHFGNARLGPSDGQIRTLGKIHVILIPIDGSFTVPHEIAAKVVKRIGANVVIPMHYFGSELPTQFFAALKGEGIHQMKRSKTAEVIFSLRRLPPPTVYMVLPPVEDVP